MEPLFALLLWGIGAALVVGPILGIIAFARVRRTFFLTEELARSIDKIEKHLEVLHRRLVALERGGAGAAPHAAPADSAAAHPAAHATSADRPVPAHPAAHAAGPQATPGPPSVPHAAAPPPPSRPPVAPATPPAFSSARPAAPPPIPPWRPAARASRMPPRPPEAAVDWERWIGIRGAAVVGAVALGLAGLLFFKYSIERGLITPSMRVVFGTLAGLACLVIAEWMRGRDYRQTAEGVSGAGIVILYAAFWASHALYKLVPMPVVFGLMVLVTAACCLLAVRHGSLLVAVLGLVGGFATPLLLSSGADRPIGLFGYVLLLDLGLLAVGHKKRWPSLGLLSLAGTVILQGLWIFARMGPARLFLGLVIVAVFAVLFVVVGSLSAARLEGAPERRRLWVGSQVGAILFPFVFALYFAGRVELGPHLYPIAILMALLGAGAGWVARRQETRGLGEGAATASVAVVAVWLMQHTLTTALAWETVAVMAGLAAVYHLFVELDPIPEGTSGPAPAAMIAALGSGVSILLTAQRGEVAVAPWLAGWAVLAALLYRHAAFPKRGGLQVAAAVGIGLLFTILHRAHHGEATFPAAPIFLALVVGAALALHAAAMARRDEVVRRAADQAAGFLPIVVLLGLIGGSFVRDLAPLPALGTALLLGALGMMAATRLGEGAFVAASLAGTLLVHVAWVASRAGLKTDRTEIMVALLVEGWSVVVFTVWPLLAARRFRTDRFAWYAAALAGPLWFPTLRRLFTWEFGDAFIGALPVALALLSFVAADHARRSWPAQDPARHRALVWFAAVALCFVAIAIPLQLNKEWITLGWALQGLAVIALWKRLDHPGLKYFGLALLGATTLRLVANPALLGYYPRSSVRLVNWLLYTYLVPAAALLGSAALLKPRETQRARDWEASLYAKGHPAGAIGAAIAAIAVVFVWINLAIADWYATGPFLTVDLGGPPAQRLTVSIAWGIYALILLGLGMGRDSLGLRWLSLCFLLVVIGKVFLYDLGALQDLYRVASLVGLAVSLILVSLLYQRFVFRRRGGGPAAPAAQAGIAEGKA